MDDIMQQVRLMYDESGEYFSKSREKKYGGKSSNWNTTQKYLDRLEPGESVLDVGCGSGRLLSGLPENVEYMGIDFSKTLIRIARENYPGREFVIASMTDGQVWEKLGKHDAVFMVASLHHLPTRELQLMVLRASKGVLKPGGFLFLSVWNLWNKKMMEKMGNVKLVAGEVYEILFQGKSGRHVMAMDERYLRELVVEAGLEITEISESENNWVMIAKN